MPTILPFGGKLPRIAPDVFIAPNAVIIGDVEIGAGSSIWFGAVLRGDVGPIRIGQRTNLQDGVVVHMDPGKPTLIGDGVTIGHGAIIHGTVIEDGAQIGMGAVTLSGSRIGAEAMVAAGALVPEGAEVPGGPSRWGSRRGCAATSPRRSARGSASGPRSTPTAVRSTGSCSRKRSVPRGGTSMAVDVSRDGHVATVVLNRPDVLNAFNSEQLEALARALEELRQDSQVRAIIITGAGDRAFAAGADISEMRDKTPSEALAFARLGQAVCNALETAPQATIAAVNGFALGGGCEVALACDIRLCSENAQLGQPEVGLGIPPGWGGTQRLARAIGRGVAKELILTGRRIDAQEALRLGLVSAVYPQEQLLEKAREMAAQIAANGPIAVQYAKEAMNRGLEADLETALAYEAQVFALAFDTADQKEGMSAFLERRKPTFEGR